MIPGTGFYVSSTRKSWLLPPHLVAPVYDDGGLVRRRPEAAYGEPGFGNGRFSAALDPGGAGRQRARPARIPRQQRRREFRGRAAPEHEGRPALEAIVAPPPPTIRLTLPRPCAWPGRNLVRMDLGTGVCVASRRWSADTADYGHWLRILGVDEYMLDDLFLAESMNLTDVRRHISWDVSRLT